MKNCKRKNKFVVNEIESEGFYGVEDILNRVTNRKKDVDGNSINWLKTRQITLFKSEPFKIYMKQSFDAENYQIIDIEKRNKGCKINPENLCHLLKRLWPDGKPINIEKLKNLKELMHLISNDAKPFYRSLIGSENIEEDIEGFGVPADFEVSFVDQ